MLYKIGNVDISIKDLEPLPFLDLAQLGKMEKDLEELLATHFLDVLAENAPLMPIFQERNRQPEADIYALDRTGNLVIFELKRGLAGADAMLQILRYAQHAGQWTFNALEEKYRAYVKDPTASLCKAHVDAFALEHPLSPGEFNAQQHLVIVGSAANDPLIDAVDYWKHRGLNVDFLPYRVYRIAGQLYFEFFALPYDRHPNPAMVKGVLFDTNRSYIEEAVWEMIEKKRISAYGDAQGWIDYVNPKDIVFYSHRWVGLIGAAEVVGPAKNDGPDQRYRDVRFLTKMPERAAGVLKFLPFGDVTKLLGKGFYWARTIKVPYLNRSEAHLLLDRLKVVLD